MTSHPILFNGEMVRALLDGRKTQTRRLVTVPWGRKRVPPWEPYYVGEDGELMVNLGILEDYDGGEAFAKASTVLTSPFGKVGDRLWVKETWAMTDMDCRTVHGKATPECAQYDRHYRADLYDNMAEQYPWRPSIHMPRWASRIELEVTGLRVERVQAITEDDATAEGVESVAEFKVLWDRLAKHGAMFDDDPWVWVYTFRRVE